MNFPMSIIKHNNGIILLRENNSYYWQLINLENMRQWMTQTHSLWAFFILNTMNPYIGIKPFDIWNQMQNITMYNKQ